jgi:hypothetical protein
MHRAQILHLVGEAAQSREHAGRLLAATNLARGLAYHQELETVISLLGLAFFKGWKDISPDWREKLWKFFEGEAPKPCGCHCGNTLESAMSGIQETLKREPEDPPGRGDCNYLGRMVLIFHVREREPLFARTLWHGLQHFHRRPETIQ